MGRSSGLGPASGLSGRDPCVLGRFAAANATQYSVGQRKRIADAPPARRDAVAEHHQVRALVAGNGHDVRATLDHGLVERAVLDRTRTSPVRDARTPAAASPAPPARPQRARTRRAAHRAPCRRTPPGCAATPAWCRSGGRAAAEAASPAPSTTSTTPYTSAARITPPMFCGRLGRCSATAAHSAVIDVSLPVTCPPLPSALCRNANRLSESLRLCSSNDRSGSRFPCSLRLAPCRFSGMHRPRGPLGGTVPGSRTTPRRRARHCA